LAVTAAGGILTAISVYQPWYGIGFTPAALSFAQQQLSALPGLAPLGQRLNAAAPAFNGHPVADLSAHQSLHVISVLLLVIAGVAIAASLVALAGARPQLPSDSGGLLTAIGVLGGALAVFRMIVPPNPAPELITMSLRPGALMSLAGCAAIAGGSWWAGRTPAAAAPPQDLAAAWSDLSGWTPS
jgi:hypothetical protein